MADEPDPRLALTLDARVVCQHELGVAKQIVSQEWVRIDTVAMQIEPDPEGRSINGCPNFNITIRPCLHTLAVRTGYSEMVTIAGKPVVLASLSGFTDGTPPGVVKYLVRDPGQQWVRVSI